MAEELTLEAWRAHLQSRGHRITKPAGETGAGFTLWPNAGTIITVAVEPDETLSPQYRQSWMAARPWPTGKED